MNHLLLFCKAQGKYNCAALIKACKDGKQRLVDELIQAGANLNATDDVCMHIWLRWASLVWVRGFWVLFGPAGVGLFLCSSASVAYSLCYLVM